MTNMSDISGSTTLLETREPKIKHLVFSGGIIYGFTFYGIVRRLHEHGFLDMDHIETIHATSVGSILGTALSLKFEWHILDNYLIHRPWQQLFPLSLPLFFQCYHTRGLFGIDTFEELFRPLFSAKDLDITKITMQELYEFTGIEQHYYTVNLMSFELVDISHTTHPDWRVLDAVYASSCAPFIFRPLQIVAGAHDAAEGADVSGGNGGNGGTEDKGGNDSWYVDGGFLMNYPLDTCLEWCTGHDHAPNTILGINLRVLEKKKKTMLNMMEYFYIIFANIVNKVSKIGDYECHDHDPHSPYEIYVTPTTMNPYDFFAVMSSKEERIKLIDMGVECANHFMVSIAETTPRHP